MKANRSKPILFLHCLVPAAILAVALAVGACSHMRFVDANEEAAKPAPPVAAELRLPYNQMQPGDALLAELLIRNRSGAPQQIQAPNLESVDFFAVGPGAIGPVKLRPVFSKKERMDAFLTLAPDRVTSRTFVFTQATKNAGDYRLQAIYHPAPRGMPSDLLPAATKPAQYLVTGAPSFRRDPDGLILKDDAIAAAKAYLTRPVSGAEAYLVENRFGFLDWWVTLTVDPNALLPNEPPRRGFYVSPYQGFVFRGREAQPFVAKPPPPAILPGKASSQSPQPPQLVPPPQSSEGVPLVPTPQAPQEVPSSPAQRPQLAPPIQEQPGGGQGAAIATPAAPAPAPQAAPVPTP